MSKFSRRIKRQTYGTSPESLSHYQTTIQKAINLKEFVDRRREDEANREGARLFGNRTHRRQRRKLEQAGAQLPGVSAMLAELAESGHTSAEQLMEFAEQARAVPLVARATDEEEPEETDQERFARSG